MTPQVPFFTWWNSENRVFILLYTNSLLTIISYSMSMLISPTDVARSKPASKDSVLH